MERRGTVWKRKATMGQDKEKKGREMMRPDMSRFGKAERGPEKNEADGNRF